MTMLNRKLAREAVFLPSSIDEEARAVTVCWTTGQRVQRRGFSEELSLDPSSVRLGRLNGGAPLLNSHQNTDLKNQIGVVERAWIEGNEGMARIRFSRRTEVEPIFQDVKDGILRKISVGYKVHKVEELDKKQRIFRAIDWEPHELSLVSVPADDGASVRNMEEEETTLENDQLDTTKIDAEIERIRVIADLKARFALSDERMRKMIKDGTTIDAARTEILDLLSKRSEQNNLGVQRVELVRDEGETRREGMINAILHRHDPSMELNENGRRYRQLNLVDMARETLGEEGRRLGREEVATRAFHSTSDFPEILGSVAKQRLLLSYASLAQRQNFWPMVRIRSVPDFKPVRALRMGEMPSLAPLPEGSEITYGTLGESADSYAISTFGKGIAVTRQMILNDEVGVFLDNLNNWAGSISRLESSMFWNCFASNPTLSDGKKLFSKEHNNKPETSQDLTIDALSNARIAMGRQQGLDKREGEYLDLHPEFLIVPIELLTSAQQLLSPEVSPQSPGQVNPFKNAYQIISTTWIKDPKSWFLATGQGQGVDLVEMAYLNGNRTPFVDHQTDFSTDSLKIKVRYDVGCKVSEYRGLYQGGYSK